MKRKFFQLTFLLLLAMGIGGSLHAQTSGSWASHTDIHFMDGVTGGVADPYVIKTADQLAGLADLVNRGQTFSEKYIELGGNIDLGLYDWEPIGNSKPLGHCFSGTFDGKGFIISNLTVEPDYPSDGVGLFGYIFRTKINDAKISNVHLEKLNILVIAPSRIGGLVGISEGSTITDCSVTGAISGFSYIGGLVGQATGTDLVKCYSFCTINSDVNYENIGGLVGSLELESTLSSCYSMGVVAAQRIIGGLVGFSSNSEVRNSYTTATAIGTSKGLGAASSIGGIIGDLVSTALSNCFARNIRASGDDARYDGSVRRVVGAYNPTGSSLQNNYAREDMLISRNNKLVPLPDDEEVGPDTPNGESVPDDFEWCEDPNVNANGDWVCGDNPYLKFQSRPVTCTTSSTEKIVVELIPELSKSNMDKIVLLDSTFVELKVGTASTDQIITGWDDAGKNLTFQPRRPGTATYFDFHLNDVFYAVAYETGKTASLPVKIIITPFKEGNGTKDNPFIIRTESQLDSVRYSFTTPKYSNYKLAENLDMSKFKKYPQGWKPIGTANKPFPGCFNGDGYIIDNLTANGDGDYQGLFGVVTGDSIKNLGLENVFVTGGNNVGALAGKSSAVIENVYTTGTVTAAGDSIGGLLGKSEGNTAIVSSCYSACLVKGNIYVGGLIGYAASKVLDCYAVGPVFGDDYFGGLLGVAVASSSESFVARCYSAGLVASVDPGNAPFAKGGFIGQTINNTGTIMSGCYFDTTTSGTTKGEGRGNSIGLEPHTTSEFAIGASQSQYFPSIPGFLSKYSGADGYYPQLNAFISPKFGNDQGKLDTKYCSALSVIPLRFEVYDVATKKDVATGDNASDVKMSFNVPSKYAIGGLDPGCEIGAVVAPGATCRVAPQGTVISLLDDAEHADTLIITQTKYPGGDVVNKKFRKICFIPEQTTPTCEPIREPSELGWVNRDVVYTLNTNAANLICGSATFQAKVQQRNSVEEAEWMPLTGNTLTFDKDTTVLVEYQAVSSVGRIGISALGEQPVNIDKTSPVIEIEPLNNSKENPAESEVTITVKFKDPRVSAAIDSSGVKTAQWEIGIPRVGSATHINLLNDTYQKEDPTFYYADIKVTQKGNYPFIFTVTDNAGNSINNNDLGQPLEIFIGNLDEYILDDVTVDGDEAKVDENDPLTWWYNDVCVANDEVHVILTPKDGWAAPVDTLITGLKYGNNPVEITIVSKDKTVVKTFVVNICHKEPVASFLTLKVNGETIPLKTGKFNYSLAELLPNEQNSTIVEYTTKGKSVECDKPAQWTKINSPYTVEDLLLGRNDIRFRVTESFAGKDSINIYTVTLYRDATLPDPDDHIDITGLEDNPYDKNDNPNPKNPFPDGKDDNGNYIYGYNLRVQCELAKSAGPSVLTVTPPNDANATVIFYSMDNSKKEIPSTSNTTNSYEFKIANYYDLSAVVKTEGEGIPSRTYHFYVVKRFEVKPDFYDKPIIYKRWDDVRAVINNPANNQPGFPDAGGYTFNDNGYEWRTTDRDGTLIHELPDDTKAYISVGSGYYVAKLTGEYKSSTESIQISQVPTCPCEGLVGAQAAILAYPSILKSGEKLTISTENIPEENLKDGNVSIISSMGNMVDKKSLTGSNTEVTMPNAPGIYLLKVSTATVTKEFKVILK
ncbi:MAG: T9SS type A sorting domain-containing protein [Candidatus Azobacteroides sp.]|nr:T9SS type A sorting domain-containing protein [Candidatus Azobacteroides sp.]